MTAASSLEDDSKVNNAMTETTWSVILGYWSVVSSCLWMAPFAFQSTRQSPISQRQLLHRC